MELRVKRVGRVDSTDQQWQRLEPLLSARTLQTGRLGKDDSMVIVSAGVAARSSGKEAASSIRDPRAYW